MIEFPVKMGELFTKNDGTRGVEDAKKAAIDGSRLRLLV
jgi:hypothetical protein